jgi:DNA ligase-associated metallophosphoesterase
VVADPAQRHGPNQPQVFERTGLTPELTVDARRAAWFPRARLLAVADLHLGFAWAQRIRGQLLPAGAPDDTLTRLVSLVEEYQPEKLVVLGDVVHAAVEVSALEDAMRGFVGRFADGPKLQFILGNHDRGLESLLARWRLPVALHRELLIEGHALRHGDDDSAAPFELAAPAGRCVIGHEHPAFALDDGVATRVKCPCFLDSERLIVLPAFSNWAAGCDIRSGRFLGRLARSARFTTALVCVGPRLLRVPL